MALINLKDHRDHAAFLMWCNCLATMCRDMLHEGKIEADMKSELDWMNRQYGTGLVFTAAINELRGRRVAVLAYCQGDDKLLEPAEARFSE